jgi:hypothetical protein
MVFGARDRSIDNYGRYRIVNGVYQKKHIGLVVEPPLWKSVEVTNTIPNIWKNKNIPNHQPDIIGRHHPVIYHPCGYHLSTMGWGNPVQHSMCSMALFPTGDQPAENAPKGVSQFPSRKQLASRLYAQFSIYNCHIFLTPIYFPHIFNI